MPIVRLQNGKILYFSHIPKAAGTAVEDYLAERFDTLGFLDRAFGRRSVLEGWTIGPPQHLPEAIREKLLPDRLFDGLFATVRHPALRLRSAFLFARDYENSLPRNLTFYQWLEDLPRILDMDPGTLKGHLRPMSQMVPEHATVFRIEEGLAPLVKWLDQQAGNSDGPRTIPIKNRLSEISNSKQKSTSTFSWTPKMLNKISKIYAEDYVRFGYTENVSFSQY